METTPQNFWRKCSSCKKQIGFGQKYWVCSVSTCNRPRTGLVFCDVRCFDAHVPMMNHRDAGAFERKAPSEAEYVRTKEEETRKSEAKLQAQTKAQSLDASHSASTSGQTSPLSDDEILVIASRVKDYIRSRSGMNTSASVLDVLSDFVRRSADRAIENARGTGRHTILDRDLR
jgi:hypothetical protein